MTFTERTDYDVIVIGGGPAGISTAICLAQFDPSVKNRMLVLEKDEHPRKKACGGGINEGVIQWLDQHGIKLSVPPLEMNRVRVVIEENAPDKDVILKPTDFMTINREEFDESLFQHALKMGISTLQREPAIAIHCEQDKVKVKTPTRELTTRILVGADGAKGIVRPTLNHDIGTRNLGRTGRTLYCMVLREGDIFAQEELEAVLDFAFTFDRGIHGYVWSFPTMLHKMKMLNMGVCSFDAPGKSNHPLSTVLSDFLIARGISPDDTNFNSHPIPGFHPESVLTGNRVVLAGDSAGVDPLLGEGISFALHYGEVAAGCILKALDTGDFSFASYRDELFRHGIAGALTGSWEAAEKIYHPTDTGNWQDLLSSILSPW
jgi:flavin-dependent dehydrogenase